MRQDIPTVNKKYNFYDDGKVSLNRHYIAEVTRIISMKESKKLMLKHYVDGQLKSLYSIFKYDVNLYPSLKLYDADTDVFVECKINGYDDERIYFARTLDGGFFSFDTNGTWMSGRLDVDNHLTENLYNYLYEIDRAVYMKSIEQMSHNPHETGYENDLSELIMDL